ncbi:class I adenylate-forming enzyme family protein [Humisphaera borealis]|uniref:AMP-binding protein n=1 Tax=Humisphaera borealis TaxID=2807512 RepID=A0A7M2X2J5_9BACT|nr:AMP-binding protein [Humisphaera borealis]QOV91987.1 AMP-binding protein [Humisphaera borealis]
MLFEHVFANAKRDPSRVLFIDDRGQTTAEQFAKMVAGFSMLFRSQTTQPRIGLFLPTTTAFAASFYGALVAGKTVVPINFLLGKKEIAHIIKDSGIDTIVSAPPLIDRIKGLPIKLIDLSTLPTSAPEGMTMPPLPTPAASDLAVIMYTSGTSGLPKGVMLTYGNLAADAQSAIDHAQLKGEHKFLGVLPLFHSTGMLATLLAPTQLGAMVLYQARFSPVGMLQAIRDHKLSLLVAVPSMYGAVARLKSAGPDDLAHVYAVISGGEPLPGNIREAFLAKFGKPIMEGYGLTETIGPISFNVPGRHKPGSVGQIVPGATIKLIDDNGNEAPQGQDGEVWMKGAMIMVGYNNLPKETAEALTPDGFFKSGDLGHLDADGYLYITGRKKDLIIVAGEKAVPREIEEILLTHPSLAHAAVIGKKDPSRGEVVVAFVVPKEGETVKPDELREHCRAGGLVQWKIPREVFVATELPMSPTGKVLKRVLAEQLAKQPT